MPKYSISLKIWHWLNAISVSVLILTYTLRITFLEKHQTASIMIEKLSQLGISLDEKNAIIIAKAIRAPMWDFHIYFGYIFTALFCWRIVLFFISKVKHNDITLHDKAISLLYKIIY